MKYVCGDMMSNTEFTNAALWSALKEAYWHISVQTSRDPITIHNIDEKNSEVGKAHLRDLRMYLLGALYSPSHVNPSLPRDVQREKRIIEQFIGD